MIKIKHCEKNLTYSSLKEKTLSYITDYLLAIGVYKTIATDYLRKNNELPLKNDNMINNQFHLIN